MAVNARPASLRARALERIAALSTEPATDKVDHRANFDRLYASLSTKQQNAVSDGNHDTLSLAEASMTIEELHVLIALCKAAPQVEGARDAEKLLEQLRPYLAEAAEQSIAHSVHFYAVEGSPWEALSKNLTTAMLSMAVRHPALHKRVWEDINTYLRNCGEKAVRCVTKSNPISGSDDRARELLTLYMSVLGFLDAATPLAHFFSISEMLDLVAALRSLLTEELFINVEGALSSIRVSEFKTPFATTMKIIGRRYAAAGRPLGAMLIQKNFLRLLTSCSSLQVVPIRDLQRQGTLDYLMSIPNPEAQTRLDETDALTEALVDVAVDAMRLADDGADYLEVSASWYQRVAFRVRGYAITIFVTCVLVNEDIADLDLLMTWLEAALADPVQMGDSNLACTVLKSLAIAAKTSPSVATALSRSIPRFLVQSGIHGPVVDVAAQCLASVLSNLPQDAMITTLYTLGNVLSIANADKKININPARNQSLSTPAQRFTQHSTGSAISMEAQNDEETSTVYNNVVRTIVIVALSSPDEKVIPLAQSVLLQKVTRVSANVDAIIIVETASLGARAGENDLKSLLKFYDRLVLDALVNKKTLILEAVSGAYVRLEEKIDKDSPSFHLYVSHLFETIISKGEVHGGQDSKKSDVELAAEGIAQLLKPLALLAPALQRFSQTHSEEDLTPMQREVWFNIAAHGFIPGSRLWNTHAVDLRAFALHTKALVAEDRSDHLESDIELNTVLRRGMSGPRTAELKKELIRLLPSKEVSIRSLPYAKVVFFHAAYAVETLKAEEGVCADVLKYFTDPSVNHEGSSLVMTGIADEVLARFFKRTLTGLRTHSPAPVVAQELAKILTACCHRIAKCQSVAASFADRYISLLPSALCQKYSLFALLELLTLMWLSCLEFEIDEYEWKSTYHSSFADVTLILSDDYEFRRQTLKSFHKLARTWVVRIINVAPQDVKGLLQTYLAEYDDEGAYGHVALGRSFAIEMGSIIPRSDQRLAAIDKQDELAVNTGSDFIAQYTTRQEYKYADALPDYDQEWVSSVQLKKAPHQPSAKVDAEVEDAQAVLSVLDHRVAGGKYVSIVELRDLLRRAVALLCRSKQDQCAIVHHLVSVPYSIFSKQSIKLGISLWLAVINENPFMESRILVEVAKGWEESIKKRKGAFNPQFSHQDPFYLKDEYAPSDRGALQRKQQAASNLISPHLRILQFLSSHFNAFRLGSPHLRKAFQRMVNITLEGLRLLSGHPLAREFHFQVILFSMSILRYSEELPAPLRWRFKDRILNAALSWFSHPSRWSFGGNKLQIKAENQLMLDVEASLGTLSFIGAEGQDSLQSLTAKQDLLIRLLKHERSRLNVWLSPTDVEARTVFTTQADKSSLWNVSPKMMEIAWSISPSLAIQISIRSQSPSLIQEVRRMILAFPEKAVGDSEALHILLEEKLSSDTTWQLKYLLYWAAINPISAVTLFLPAYNNNPFIIQYAMRALEEHSVDVTFFYVPQIVQTLRYDALGYVQRYIVETGKVSQLFAHQIIWNMKANAYKDEEATIEDSLKPTLDTVKNNLLDAFSDTDKAFYEREFSFFDEVTDISGKLRPYIKKEKSEKKQKIEEELRKIKIEVGVYLPSNPDGVVIGIDRKSGKPLQSHAKAPYMATFRIRKTKGEVDVTEEMLEDTNEKASRGLKSALPHESTYDVWQSAIFKVGDDCRQDVLALQMISEFRNIFNSVGLDVWVYPYRVTATAPGCGVIDVLPNSISRDMLGREAVNGLYDYFVSKYGGEDSIKFQEARNNFVKSMASYSVISYLLQMKDRHNGNIMIDDAGHIIHIDFGFCFDIAPGGIKFERAPFKLTTEMIAVMGGSQHSQSYRWFEELCIKSFLASRPFADKLSHLVVLMMGSGLPCFKPETIQHFKERFVPGKTEREAAEFMRDLVKKSYSSYSTKRYDQFQLLTNGIPY